MVFLDPSVTLVMELENLSETNNFSAIFLMVCLEQPHKGLQYLESSMLIGTLITLTLLNQQGNLVFLRSLGLSPLKIVLIAGMGPVILSLSILFMDEFIFTGMSQNSDISSLNRQEHSSQSASWQYKDDTLIGLKKLNNRDVEAIQIIEFDQQGNLKESRKFKQGVLMNDQLIVYDPNDPEGGLKDFSFRSAPTLSSMSIETLSLRSLFQLQKNYHALSSSDDLRLIMSSMYAKIFLPLSIIAVIFLAGSLMFGMIRSGGVGKQIVIGVFIGLVYDLTKDLSIASFLTYQWPILWAHLLPIILVILASLVSYKRI
jgi:lipopolysaccharide export system permease protein